MSEVVLINAFVVPSGEREAYLAKYHEVMERMRQQPGFRGGALHRAIHPGRARFQFVNVNRWESEAAFHAAIATVQPNVVFGDLAQRIEASPALFAIETAYPAAAS